jgi:hypothetical protein
MKHSLQDENIMRNSSHNCCSDDEEEYLLQHYGLPEKLPSNEKILWQGRPGYAALLKKVFFFKYIAIYLLLLIVVSFVFDQYNYGLTEGFEGLILNTLIGVFCLSLFMLLAYFSYSTTIYTITDKRIVMRIGMVLTLSLNIPFKKIESADLKINSDGSGDISITLHPAVKIAYIHLWPHCRAFYFSNPRPTLKCIIKPEETSSTIKKYWEKEIKSNKNEKSQSSLEKSVVT